MQQRSYWTFSGSIVKVIDGQTLQIGFDLGFGIWKKVIVRLNRIRVYPDSDTAEFFDKILKRKPIQARVFRKEDRYKNERFYAELYAAPTDLPTLALKDINLSISSPYRVPEMVNINDLLLNKGMAENVEHRNDFSHDDRPPRTDPEIRDDIDYSDREEDHDDSFRGRPPAERPGGPNQNAERLYRRVPQRVFPTSKQIGN